MIADIFRRGVRTPQHKPDDILEAAKGQGIETVVVVGLRAGKPIWVSASTLDVQEVVFALGWAKSDMMDRIVQEGRMPADDD